MDAKKAFDILNLSETVSAGEIEKAYQETVNEFNARIRDAVTPTLKKKYQEELKIREEAFIAILKSNLPSQHPSFVIPKLSESISETEIRAKSKLSKTNLLILIGTAIIILLSVLIYNQVKKSNLNKTELSKTDSTQKNTLTKDSIIPVSEKIIVEQIDSSQLPNTNNSFSTNTPKDAYIIFKEKGKYGVKRGSNITIKPIYDSLISVKGSNNLFIAMNKNNKSTSYSINGILKSNGTFIIPLAEKSKVRIKSEDNLIGFEERKKCSDATWDYEDYFYTSVVDFKGNILVQDEEQCINGFNFVRKGSEKGKLIPLLQVSLKNPSCVVYINTISHSRTKCYAYGNRFSNEGKIDVALTNLGMMRHDDFGFINEEGNEVITPEYDEVYPFSEGLAAVLKNNKWGFIDKSGELKIDYHYYSGGCFHQGKLSTSNKEGWGFDIDKKGNMILPEPYHFENGQARIKANARENEKEHWVIINEKGDILSEEK
jgi:hypothetical protein